MGNVRRISLSKKLLFLVFVASTIGTTITSLIQIFVEYDIAVDDQQSEIQVFESTAVAGITNLVWNYSFPEKETSFY